jgi:DNA-binding protein H-NS
LNTGAPYGPAYRPCSAIDCVWCRLHRCDCHYRRAIKPKDVAFRRRPTPRRDRGPIIPGKKMKPHDLESMSLDELWSLHELVASLLAQKISTEKARLDQRLRELGQSTADSAEKVSHARRPYPQVFPKYRNPTRPSETWAGRGKQPRWLTAQLSSGKRLDDFRIQPSSDRTRRAAAQGSGRPNKKTARRRSA